MLPHPVASHSIGVSTYARTCFVTGVECVMRLRRYEGLDHHPISLLTAVVSMSVIGNNAHVKVGLRLV